MSYNEFIEDFEGWRNVKDYPAEVAPERVYLDYCGHLVENNQTDEQLRDKAAAAGRILGVNRARLYWVFGGL